MCFACSSCTDYLFSLGFRLAWRVQEVSRLCDKDDIAPSLAWAKEEKLLDRTGVPLSCVLVHGNCKLKSRFGSVRFGAEIQLNSV